MVKNLLSIQETRVRSLGWDNPLEEGMATHSTILTWRISMDRGTWQATVHGVTKSQTRLSNCAQAHQITSHCRALCSVCKVNKELWSKHILFIIYFHDLVQHIYTEQFLQITQFLYLFLIEHLTRIVHEILCITPHWPMSTATHTHTHAHTHVGMHMHKMHKYLHRVNHIS